MTTTTKATSVPARRWPKRLALGSVGIALLAIVAFNIAQQRSDGPLNDMIPGGELRSGTLVTDDVADWQFADGETIELQLLEPRKSRYTGAIAWKGQLYIPCDLGYMWGRFDGTTRHVLHLIYVFKRWHEDALEDGRVVVRIDGKRYPRQAVRVTDAATVAALKRHLEDLARGWLAPEQLGPPPTSSPNDIWFFRLDPRTP